MAQALIDHDDGCRVAIVGRRGGVAERLVVDAGIQLETLAVSGVDVTNPRTLIRAMGQLPQATLAARRLLQRMRPDVVVGAGGYVSVPVVMAAHRQRLPVVLMEQNAYPGRATRMLARRARYVAASFAETSRFLPNARVVHTGNPIRRDVRALVPATVRDSFEHLLVTGGSQGARRINQAITGCIAEVLGSHAALRVTHQSGVLDWEFVEGARRKLALDMRRRYVIAPFFNDIGKRLADCDAVVMRAGGSSIAEASALGRPMVLVPYPHAGGHQRFNARPYVQAGAAVMVDDAACTAPRLRAEIASLCRDARRWHSMAACSAAMGLPDADRRVVELITAAASQQAASAA